MRRVFVSVVLDGVGIGAQPDSAVYGDAGADTLGHVCSTARPSLPNLARMGLGRIRALDGVPAVPRPNASWGRMREVSLGKDSTTGHWELAGLRLERPFPTYPCGFPRPVLDRFVRLARVPGTLGNHASSGTAILEELGEEHVATGRPIVYTSADSVFQVAAHVDVVPLDRLYAWCRLARDRVCVGDHAVGRVIARPFEGRPGAWRRLSERRLDFALRPPGRTVQEALREAGVHTVALGKIGDLFAGVGFGEIIKSRDNADGMRLLLDRLAGADGEVFLWINLVDFDQDFGHRNDPGGFARALEDFDAGLPALLDRMGTESRLVVTADHGNDPTTPGTDHTREYVPVLSWDGSPGRDLGTRTSLNDHAATVAAWFGVRFETEGSAF